MIRLLSLTLIIALCGALPARADELHLKNGDRITGTTTSLAGGTLFFKAIGGDLKVAWTDVASLSLDQPMLVTIGTAAAVSATFAPDAAGNLVMVPGGPVAITSIVALARPQPAWIVAGGAGAGVVQSAGNTRINNVRINGDLAATSGRNAYHAGLLVTHANDRGIETARNWDVIGKYDRFVTARTYTNANLDFTNDRFQDFDLRTALGAGLGYALLATPQAKLNADAGIAWVHENFRSIPDDSYAAAHESVNFSWAFLPDRMQVFHLHDGYFGSNKLFVRMQNGVRVGLAKGFVTTIEEDLLYHRRPAPGLRTTDRTFSLTLGYRF
jgi:putative salt-induced outer membrane protein YdiY